MNRWVMMGCMAYLFTMSVQAADVIGGRAHNMRKPDPEATKLLREAREARALWKQFSGFTADVEVNMDGKISRGKVRVDALGKVSFEQLEQVAETWARPVLSADVGHRLDEAAETTCYFADTDAQHPLGRAIGLIGDGMGSVYRVRDKQVMVVNRKAGKSRFSITLLESRFNKEGKYLPGSYVVHYWDADKGDLQRTDSYTNTWKRVGAFDLPVTTRVVSTSRTVSAKSFTLSNHALLP